MPRTELTLEEKNVILNFYENTTAETSVRKMDSHWLLWFLFQKDFIKSVSKLRVRSRKYRARLTFLMN